MADSIRRIKRGGNSLGVRSPSAVQDTVTRETLTEIISALQALDLRLALIESRMQILKSNPNADKQYKVLDSAYIEGRKLIIKFSTLHDPGALMSQILPSMTEVEVDLGAEQTGGGGGGSGMTENISALILSPSGFPVSGS